MACMIHQSGFVTWKVATLLMLISCSCVSRGFCLTGTDRLVCSGSTCVNTIKDRVDFATAGQRCRAGNGEIMTFQSGTDVSFLDTVIPQLEGNFWVGLRLPANACSNLSAPMRGYEWTSGGGLRNLSPSVIGWRGDVIVCSPHCVSLSKHHRWKELPCSDKADGFLCKTKHRSAYQAQRVADPHVVLSAKGCSDAPCEHTCTPVTGGFKCSCFEGYAPDSKDLAQCRLHCGEEKCPASCRGNSCRCPEGFILNGQICEDINECLSNFCAQFCQNTFGGFICSCKEGFVLKDQFKCVEGFNITPPAAKPTPNITHTDLSGVSSGSFLWIWIFLVVVVVVFICTLRFYVASRRKHREQNGSRWSTAPADDTGY